MTIPLWVLFGFAAWTIFILIGTIGVYRWQLILTKKANFYDFPADVVHGANWYRRAMRAHANCIENLPIFTVLVVILTFMHIESYSINILSIAILIARMLQSITHILFNFTNFSVGMRFVFFIIQIISMIWMGIIIFISV